MSQKGQHAKPAAPTKPKSPAETEEPGGTQAAGPFSWRAPSDRVRRPGGHRRAGCRHCLGARPSPPGHRP